ncbi:MAG: aminotransferase class IV [Bacteroidetes bacterium]|nr:aminotransferase class IV [Bacteroidota bacterium]MBS1540315.1 aminotransferase class IV [Bacteroidota bacterium]
MCRFIESIRLYQGVVENLPYHQERVNRTFNFFSSTCQPVNLQTYLSSVQLPASGLHKIRIVYDAQIQLIQINPYEPKNIRSLKLTLAEKIPYNYKYEDRSSLAELYQLRRSCDDILIVQEGLITDTYFANVAFKRKDQWVTPHSYLLNGTQRQFLLDTKIIEEENISLNDLHRYEKIKLINSMLKFESPEMDVCQIVK